MLGTTDDLGPSGKTLPDTWSRMLQILNGVSPPVAEAIVQACPTIAQYWRRLQTESYRGETESFLQDSMVHRMGYTSSGLSRRLGPAASKRIHQNFTATDPDINFR